MRPCSQASAILRNVCLQYMIVLCSSQTSIQVLGFVHALKEIHVNMLTAEVHSRDSINGSHHPSFNLNFNIITFK